MTNFDRARRLRSVRDDMMTELANSGGRGIEFADAIDHIGAALDYLDPKGESDQWRAR